MRRAVARAAVRSVEALEHSENLSHGQVVIGHRSPVEGCAKMAGGASVGVDQAREKGHPQPAGHVGNSVGTLRAAQYLKDNMVSVRRFRPLAAIASAVLLVQLILAGSGFACVTPGMSEDAARDAMMAGMEMPSDLSAPQSSNEAPCHLPWAPAGCQPMAPCSPAVMPPAIVTLASNPGHAQCVTPPVAIAPPSRTVRPEPPPPRA